MRAHLELCLEFLGQQWVLAVALLVTVGMLIAHETRKAGPALTPQQAINLINREGGVFVDLREAVDYKLGHIINALNIPTGKIDSRRGELEKYRTAPIVLVCKMGQQAGGVGKKLKDNGFEKVYKMKGGMLEWDNLQLPTAT
ncbi:MAG: rhodanese-like domain-containing protein [Parahaliea sp.]